MNGFRISFDKFLDANGLTQTDVAGDHGRSQSGVSKLRNGGGAFFSGCELITTLAEKVAAGDPATKRAIIDELCTTAAKRDRQTVRYDQAPHILSMSFKEAKMKAIELGEAANHTDDLKYIQQMRRAAEADGNRRGVVQSMIFEALRYRKLGLPLRASEIFDEAREELILPGDGEMDALRRVNQGETYFVRGMFRRAEECIREAVDSAKAFLRTFRSSGTEEDKDRVANALHVIGYGHHLLGRFALDRHDFDASERHFGESASFHRQAEVHVSLDSSDKTKTYEKLAKPVFACRDEAYRILALGLAGRREEAMLLADEIRRETSEHSKQISGESGPETKFPEIHFLVELHSAAMLRDVEGLASARVFAVTNGLKGLVQHADYVGRLLDAVDSENSAGDRPGLAGWARRAQQFGVALIIALSLQWGAPALTGFGKSTLALDSSSFGPNQQTLTVTGAASLKAGAAPLGRSSGKVTIEAYAHSGNSSALDLAVRRAQAVAEFLVESQGVDRARLVVRVVASEHTTSSRERADGRIVIQVGHETSPLVNAWAGVAEACYGQ